MLHIYRHIYAPEGYLIQLNFDHFQTECFWDTLEVRDGSDDDRSPLLAELCGNRDASLGYADVLVSSSSKLSLFFKSDSNIVTKGFRARFKHIGESAR